jgi:uncharacterized protein
MPGKDRTGPQGTGRGTGNGFNKDQGKGRGRNGRAFSAGPGGECVCPKCGKKESHNAGQPCNQIICENCNIPMTRN